MYNRVLMLHTPFYDPKKSYEENYSDGPFGDFAPNAADTHPYTEKGDPQQSYLGIPVYLPFGIPAGPLLNSNFVAAAFAKNFDVCVYKTVRSDIYPCHPFPNVLSLEIAGDLTLEKLKSPLVAGDTYQEPLSITNSFGVPSRSAESWQADAEKGIKAAGKGQVMVLSFMGTVKPDQTQQEFIDDYVLAAKLSHETGAKILEVNLSCPNIGNEGLVCYNLDVTAQVCKGIRSVIGNTPLILKVGYYQDQEQLKKLAEIANEYANSVAGINTLQAEVRDSNGEPALPGKNRLRSGVCGTGIRWAGLETVEKLSQIRRDNGFTFHIEGVGGVTTPADYHAYKSAGADSVMSATGAMWNPYLAREVKESLAK